MIGLIIFMLGLVGLVGVLVYQHWLNGDLREERDAMFNYYIKACGERDQYKYHSNSLYKGLYEQLKRENENLRKELGIVKT